MIMQVAGRNIVCAVLFIFKGYSHTHLVDPKTAERGREGRYEVHMKDEETEILNNE